jgi:beta-lactam-binding protein with PASTA domain
MYGNGSKEAYWASKLAALRRLFFFRKSDIMKLSGKHFSVKITAFCAALAVAVGAGVYYRYSDRSGDRGIVVSDEVEVPNLAGLSLKEAELRGRQVGLEVRATDKLPSAELDADTILMQEPSDGAVCRKGDVIYVTVSSGSDEDEVLITKYVGMDSDQIKDQLEKSGLVVEMVESDNTVMPSGIIAGQSAESGDKLRAGDKIKLVVSSKPNDKEYSSSNYSVPNFVGTNIDYISSVIGAEHFRYKILTEYNSQFGEGIIFDQSVRSTDESGCFCQEGTEITVSVSMGVEKIVVPDTQYKTVDSAVQMLSEAGIAADIRYMESESVEINHVAEQDAPGGSLISKDEPVVIYISSGYQYEKPSVDSTVIPPAETTAVTEEVAQPVETTAVETALTEETQPSETVVEEAAFGLSEELTETVPAEAIME